MEIGAVIHSFIPWLYLTNYYLQSSHQHLLYKTFKTNTFQVRWYRETMLLDRNENRYILYDAISIRIEARVADSDPGAWVGFLSVF